MKEQNKNYCSAVNANMAVNYLEKSFNLDDRTTLVMGKRQLRHIYGRSSSSSGCEYCYKATMGESASIRKEDKKRFDLIHKNYLHLKERIEVER